MTVKTGELRVEMKGDTQVENITARVREALASSGLREGLATVFIKHTTASVLIIEDEPGIRADTRLLWEHLVPRQTPWEHNTRNVGEDNGHSHLRAQLQGSSVLVPFAHGELLLGRWQEIVIVDFDTRSRGRDLIVQFMGVC